MANARQSPRGKAMPMIRTKIDRFSSPNQTARRVVPMDRVALSKISTGNKLHQVSGWWSVLFGNKRSCGRDQPADQSWATSPTGIEREKYRAGGEWGHLPEGQDA